MGAKSSAPTGSNPELIDQAPLLLSQFGQFGTGIARLVRPARHFIGHLANIDYVAVDIFSHRALFFCSAAIWVFMSLITETA